MTTDEFVGYFGYGSLVNRQTLKTKYTQAVPVQLKGWRRHWQSRAAGYLHYSGKDIALLSVHAQSNCRLSGMLIIDRRDSLGEVDVRERGYDRQRLNRDQLELSESTGQIDIPQELFVYVGKTEPVKQERSKLLQSYLDTVMSGYLAEYGEGDIEHLLETTVGFDRDLIADRDNPIYSRAIKPDVATAARFDAILQSKGAVLI